MISRQVKRIFSARVANGLNVLVVLAMILGTLGGALTGTLKPGVAQADSFEEDSGAWTLKGSAYRYPEDFSGEEYRYSSEVTDEEYVVLTRPLGAQPQAGILWLNQEISSTFNASFRYMAGGGTGGEGLVFMFYKDRFSQPAAGGSLGFESTSGQTKVGYGIEFDGYQNAWDTSERHVALVANTTANHLVEASDNRTETEIGEWHWVEIDVSSADTVNSTIRVKLDDMLVLKWTCALNTAYSGIGLAASTSVDNTNWYIVDEVQVKIRDAFVESTNLWNSLGSAGRDTGNLNVFLTGAQPNDFGVLWLNQEITSPFGVSFSYQAGGGTGADGLAFMFYKNAAYNPGTGASLGFNPDSGSAAGYGVEFDSYDNGYEPADIGSSHVALIANNTTNHLVSENLTMTEYQYDQDGNFVYDASGNVVKRVTDKSQDGEWHWIRVLVGDSSVDVWIDEFPVLSWTGTLDRTYGGIGFCAATGSAFQEQRIDNVVISVPELKARNLHDLVEFLDRAKDPQAPESTDGYLWTTDSGASPGADGSEEEGSLNVTLGWDDSFSYTAPDVTLYSVGNNNVRLTNPTVTLSPSAELRLSVGSRVRAQAEVGGQVNLGCGLEAELHGDDVSLEAAVPVYIQDQIFVQWADYVPIEEEVCFQIYVGVSIEHLNVDATVGSGIDATAGISLTAGNWDAPLDASVTPTFNTAMRPITWDGTLDGTLRVFAGARLELLLYSFAGLKFEIEPYVKVHGRLTGTSQSSSDFSWDWGAGVDFFAGLTARGIGDAGWRWNFPFYDPSPEGGEGIEIGCTGDWKETHTQVGPQAIAHPPYKSSGGSYPWYLTVESDEGTSEPDDDIYLAHNGIDYAFQAITSDNDSDRLRYTFYWDDGTQSSTDWRPSNVTASAKHSWSQVGYYHVKVKATDEHGAETGWSAERTVHVFNQAPNPPTVPSTTGDVYDLIARWNTSFSSSANDPDYDHVRLTFDWGDNSRTSTIGLVDSNEDAAAYHAWNKNGTYQVRAYATDEWGATSDYSGSREVSVGPNSPPPQYQMVQDCDLANSPTSIAVDSQDNVIVAGYVENGSGGQDAWRVAKYSREGELRWDGLVNDPGTGSPIPGRALSVAVDSQGSVLVAGYMLGTESPTPLQHPCVVKLGTPTWLNVDTANEGTYNAVAAMPSGQVVVAGKIGRGVARVYTPGNSFPDRELYYPSNYPYPSDFRSVAVEPGSGAVFLGGSYIQLVMHEPFCYAAVWKWTTDGSVSMGKTGGWTVVGHDDFPAFVSITVDPSDGRVVGVRNVPSDANDTKWETVKFSADLSTLEWNEPSNQRIGGGDEPKAIAADSSGNIYVLGQSQLMFQSPLWLYPTGWMECWSTSGSIKWTTNMSGNLELDMALTSGGLLVTCGGEHGWQPTVPPNPSTWGELCGWHVLEFGLAAPWVSGPPTVDAYTGTFTAIADLPPGVKVWYNFDWGDGTISVSDNATDSTSQSWTHTWTTGGAYRVKANVTWLYEGAKGFTSPWSPEWVVQVNHAPEKPPIPSGPTVVNPGLAENYYVITTDVDGDLMKYTVDWGNGYTVSSQYSQSGEAVTFYHWWPNPGTYKVRVQATDGHGVSGEWSDYLSVRVNRLPVAEFSYGSIVDPAPSTFPTTADVIQFTDTSYDPDGDQIVAWWWDFGDAGGSEDPLLRSTAQNPAHQYTDSGTYEVTLQVCDRAGGWSTVTRYITIGNVPPQAGFVSHPVSQTERNRIQFYGGTKLAVDGTETALSYDTDGTIVAWLWDFGDGWTSTEPNPVHEYLQPGTYVVTLTVTDDDGATSTTRDHAKPRVQLRTSAAVASSAAALAASAEEESGGWQRKVMAFPPLANFTAVPVSGAEPLTVTFTDQSLSHFAEWDLESWIWDFGDGSPTVTWDADTYPPGGVIVHQFPQNAVYQVTLTVQDKRGGIGTKVKAVGPPAPPAVTTGDATNVAGSSATLNGTLTSMGSAAHVSEVTVSFEWGPSTGAYPNETTGQVRTGPGTFSANLIGLAPETTYHFRAKAVGHGTAYGSDMVFTTPNMVLGVSTLPATNITPTSATLNGKVTIANPRFTAVSAGGHSLALRDDGTLWAWGPNSNGQLGLGDTTNRLVPTQVGSDTNWVAVSAGPAHSLGVRSDGTLWAWGRNNFDQLGLGDYVGDTWNPTRVGSDTNWVAASAGYDFSLGVRSDGTLWAWGKNWAGQLGLGYTSFEWNIVVPTRVGTGTDWTAISAANECSLGLRSDGTLWAWGWNGYGQLGLGDTTGRVVPTRVGSDTNWVAASAGTGHSLGLRSDGTLWAWGFNYRGQLGLGDSGVGTERHVPTRVGSEVDWAALSASGNQSLGLRSDGTLWAWGDNTYGQLGLGDSGVGTERHVPTRVGSATNWEQVVAGGSSLGVRSDGTLWAWGYNSSGQLGLGDTTNRVVPTQVMFHPMSWLVSFEWGLTKSYGNKTPPQPMTSAGAFSADISGLTPETTYHFRAKLVGNTITYSPDATFTSCRVPLGVRTNPATNITLTSATLNGAITALGQPYFATVSSGTYHSLGVSSDGALWTWGANTFGQLGLGDTTDRLVPTQVGSATDWTAVDGGYQHCLGVRLDGTLWAWGRNQYGQLGLGDKANRLVPTQVGNATNWIAVAAGSSSSLGLCSDGTLWAWGSNGSGALGQGDITDRLVPTQVGNATDWAAVAAGGGGQCLGLRSDSTLWAWGGNGYGQLGLGDTTNRLVPTQVGSAASWSAVSAGTYHCLGLRSDGTIWAWGYNVQGQLGVGNTSSRLVPTQAGSGTNWVAVAAGDYHSLALRSDGTLWAWGLGGALGLGDTTNRLVPTQVGSATDWAAMAGGLGASLGVRSDSTLLAWGGNGYGQLGLGDTTNRLTPTQVSLPLSCRVWFDWGLDTGYGNTTMPQTMTSTGAFSADISGLTPGITYHFRAKAVGNGTANGDDMTFTTGTLPPEVSTGAASDISEESARLNGTLHSLGTAWSVTVSFVWGTTLGGPYANETPGQLMIGSGSFCFDLGDLTPGTTYYYKAKAVGDGTVYGGEISFDFLVPPNVVTDPASNIGSTSATLNGGVVSPGTAPAVFVCFEWGLTASYGNITPIQTQVAPMFGPFSADIGGLTPGTTYHFRAVVTGDGGDLGDDMTFTTTPAHPAWDINQDGKVDYKDLAILGAHYGQTIAQPPYPAWDINQDGKVDYKDLAMLGAHYGEEY